MGTYTDFFLATPDDLRRAFVGWRRPLPQRVERQRLSLFTRKPMTMLSWVPDPADTPAPAPFPEVTLGARLGRFPVAPFKGLDPLSLGELVATALGEDAWREGFADGSVPPPLVSPDADDSHFLAELPAAFVTAVAALTADDVARVADAWAQAALCGWEAQDYADVLTELRALAARGLREGKGLYYWM